MDTSNDEVLERALCLLGELRVSFVGNTALGQEVWSRCASIVEDADAVLRDAGLRGPWEVSDLEASSQLIEKQIMPRLALVNVMRSLVVARERASGIMSEQRYTEQVQKLKLKRLSLKRWRLVSRV